MSLPDSSNDSIKMKSVPENASKSEVSSTSSGNSNEVSGNDDVLVLSDLWSGGGVLKDNFSSDLDGMVNMMKGEEAREGKESGRIYSSGQAGPSSSQPKTKAQLEEEQALEAKKIAYRYLAQGKLNLVMRDYEPATEILSKACEGLSQIYGQLAFECVDAYYLYGQALLEYWREVKKGKPEDTVEEDDEAEVANDPIDADDDGAQAGETDTGGKNEDEVENSVQDDETSENGQDEPMEVEEKVEDGGEEVSDKEEDTEDDLQLAWEMLDLAKKICSSRGEEAGRLLQILMKLAEVSVESDNGAYAVADLMECLALHAKHCPENGKMKGEIYSHMASAYYLLNDVAKAKEACKTAMRCFGEVLDKEGTSDKEKECVRELVDQITVKMYLLKTSTPASLLGGPQASGAVREAAGPSGLGGGECSTFASGIAGGSEMKGDAVPSSSMVNDLTHLVRKKRPSEEENGKEVGKMPKYI